MLLFNNKILFASESTGYMSKSGNVYSCFLTSYSKTIESIKKCQELQPETIIVPHYGILDSSETQYYWQKCLIAANKSKGFILQLFDQGFDEIRILKEYEKEFQDVESKLEQPLDAFRINSLNLIKAVIKKEERNLK